MIKTREMFSSLVLINNSVTIWLYLLLTSISAIVPSKIINIFLCLFKLLSLIFAYISFISVEYSIKALESLQCFKPATYCLLISNWYFAWYWPLPYKQISLVYSNLLEEVMHLLFQDPEPPIINILYQSLQQAEGFF